MMYSFPAAFTGFEFGCCKKLWIRKLVVSLVLFDLYKYLRQDLPLPVQYSVRIFRISVYRRVHDLCSCDNYFVARHMRQISNIYYHSLLCILLAKISG